MDSQIIASSEFDADHSPIYARLHSTAGAGSWVAGTDDDDQWLAIDLLNEDTKVTGVATQGRNTADNHWVTSYKLAYSDDLQTNYFYKEQGQSEDKVICRLSQT